MKICFSAGWNQRVIFILFWFLMFLDYARGHWLWRCCVSQRENIILSWSVSHIRRFVAETFLSRRLFSFVSFFELWSLRIQLWKTRTRWNYSKDVWPVSVAWNKRMRISIMHSNNQNDPKLFHLKKIMIAERNAWSRTIQVESRTHKLTIFQWTVLLPASSRF